MAITRITVNPRDIARLRKKLKDLKKPADKKTAQKVASTIRKEMKAMIKVGLSPVKGKGRYKGYSSSYKDAIQGDVAFYTDKQKRLRKIPSPSRQDPNLKKKQTRPVNLKLSGKMLRALKTKVNKLKDGWSSTVGIFSNKMAERAGFNEEMGRAIFPDTPREGFAQRIQLKINDIYLKRIRAITRRQR